MKTPKRTDTTTKNMNDKKAAKLITHELAVSEDRM